METSTTVGELTLIKSCTSGCNGPIEKGTVSKSYTTDGNEPKDKISVTTIAKCSFGGCENVPVTIGETTTLNVTFTSCSNDVCATKVKLVAEYVGATSVGGRVDINASVSTIENNHSVSTFYDPASRTMGLIIVLLLSFIVL